MKSKLTQILWFMGWGVILLAGAPVQAQTTANGPYYATPSWDQTLACATLATCPRFIVLSNMGSAAVLDRETGLVWERSPDTTLVFPRLSAQIHCNQRTVGNRKGWRLPTIQELASLVDGDPANTSSPRLPPGHPFSNVQSIFPYWSATTVAASAGAAWGVNFFDGGVGTSAESALFVWCVRGGQGVDPQ